MVFKFILKFQNLDFNNWNIEEKRGEDVSWIIMYVIIFISIIHIKSDHLKNVTFPRYFY